MFHTALHDWHAARGGRLVDFAGWRMPVQFSSIVEEHHAVRQRAGLFDIAHMGRLWFRGPDAVACLDHLLTNHVAKMAPGQVRYSLVCAPDGGILDDVLVTRLENECLLVVNASNREKIVGWIDAQRGEFDVKLVDDTRDSFMLALQGPRALEILQPHVDGELSPLKYYRCLLGNAFGVPAVISRTGYTGEDGFELIVSREVAEEIWTKLLAAGESAGLLPCGLGCRDTLRLEAAMPLYGHEMDETVDPFTAGLAFGVKLDKPDFIGRAALVACSQRDDLPVRVGLQLEGKRIAREGSQLFAGDRQIGRVTSGTFSPTLERSIAMGMLPREFGLPGRRLDVDIRGRREPATVVALPFYQRSR